MTDATTVNEQRLGPVARERYGVVLLLVLGSYLVSGISDHNWVKLASAVIWLTILIVVLWSPGIPVRLRRLGVTATGGMLLAAVGLVVAGGVTELGVLAVMVFASQFLAIFAILSRIAQHRTVTMQTVMGAISAYALIGFAMAALYFAVASFGEQTPFSGIGSDGDYVYFSFITLTTVGFGDITPVTILAKRLVVLEAFVGQVFLITLVARLVSLWGRPLRAPSE